MVASNKGRNAHEIMPTAAEFDTIESMVELEVGLDTQNRRRFYRAAVEAPVAVRLLDEAGNVLCRGAAVLRDLSLEGAFLAKIRIEEIVGDVGPSELSQVKRLAFTIVGGPLEGVEATARPVRVGRKFSGVGLELENGFHINIIH